MNVDRILRGDPFGAPRNERLVREAEETNVKPGTRCKGPEHDRLLDGAIADYNEITNDRLRGSVYTKEYERNAARYVNVLKAAEAVRMVTVEPGTVEPGPYQRKQLPMCASCAAWHEAKAGTQ